MTSSPKDMPRAYNPADVEGPIYRFWMEKGYFTPVLSPVEGPAVDPGKKPFVIIMPPPNVTGELHLGHALTAAIEDILARWHRMLGEPTLWLPGKDHAGIATQVVVERQLAEEGASRQELGRERFVERVWQWVRQYGSTIDEQHKRLGTSCDWSRLRFTLDPGPSKAVRTTFVNLYNKGLIYRGERIINWCIRCSTALSDLEVEHQETEGRLYYVKYPLADGEGFITVATTRPETMLGDTAVAVHPRDPRYQSLIGHEAVLPILGRRLPIVADDAIDPEFGTGALKVTPGHDPVDFDIGQRHNLPVVTAIGDDGTMTTEAGPFQGQERYHARKAVVERLEQEGLLEKTEPYDHSVGHCQRCHTAVEPLVSKQWFVKIQPLAQPAIEAVEQGRIKIVPERFARVYINWMENIRDWCISRQLWWGHRIPVWYCASCDGDNIVLTLSGERVSAPGSDISLPEPIPRELGRLSDFLNEGRKLEEIDIRGESANIGTEVSPIVSVEAPKTCPRCNRSELFQDPDVLDTWFSSGLWTHSTLGWPDETEDLAYFYPTSVMETGYDILFFWVARMIMLGIENMGHPPFHTVFLHGLVRDAEGVKMSKTRGNVLDPLALIDMYGTDALRFALTTGTAPGNDLRLSEGKLESSRNFANKLWNASRFVLGGLEGAANLQDWRDLPALSHREDRWIVSRLNHVVNQVDQYLERFEMGEAQREVYEFLWSEFCDWYIELAKVRLRAGQEPSPQPVLAHVLEKILRLLHPFMPFITEEVWQRLTGLLPREDHLPDSVMVSPYPTVDESRFDPQAEGEVGQLISLVRAVRNVRAQLRVDASRQIDALVDPKGFQGLVQDEGQAIRALARIGSLDMVERMEEVSKNGMVTVVADQVVVALPLGDVVDLAAERDRLGRELKESLDNLGRVETLLSRADFTAKAPEEVIERERERAASLRERSERLREILAQLPE